MKNHEQTIKTKPTIVPMAFAIGAMDNDLIVIDFKDELNGEEHVIGVEISGRGKPFGGVELDPVAQMESVGQAVLGNIPACGQGRSSCGAAFFKFSEAVVDRFGRIVVGSGCVLRGFKTGRAAFGAKYQAVGGTGERAAGQYAGADEYR